MSATTPVSVGRYELFDQIATGGMGTVHIGRLKGAGGFARIVAIKRLHTNYAKDPDFASMLLDEARLAARVQHVNVVQTLDVVAEDGELFLVMDYVRGQALSRLLRAARSQGEPLPVGVASSILCQALAGLHAAHEATDERGVGLQLVHRDVSPQNVLVGADGIARVLDFGIAKATSRLQTTRDGQIKGKLAYMSPEQLLRRPVDRRADIFAAGIVAWEALTGRRLFAADDQGAVIAAVLDSEIEPPSRIAPALGAGTDEVVLRALRRSPDERFQTAQEMASALRKAIPPADAGLVSEWVLSKAGDVLESRSQRLVEIESQSTAAGKSAARSSSAPAAAQATLTDLSATGESRPLAVAKRGAGRRRVPLVAGSLVFVAAATALAYVGFARFHPTPVPDTSAAPNPAGNDRETTVATSHPTVSPESSASTASAPPASARAEPPASAPAAASGQPVTHAAAPSAPHRLKPASTTRIQHKKPGCDPPYTVDSNGDKHFKPECF